MSDHNWSTLLKQQDQFVHYEDRLQQQRKLRIKQLYKNQLQKMIQYQRNHSQDQKQSDKKLVNFANQQQKRRMLKQRQQLQYKHRKNQQIARENMKNNQQKRDKLFHDYSEEKKLYALRYKRAVTQVKQQAQSKMQYRQFEKMQLAKAYDSQLKMVQTRKKLQKMEDQKYSKLLQQIEKKKQQNRRSYFDKLRNGYKQNPQVYQNSATWLMKNQQQRNEFLKKISNQNPLSNYQTQKQKQQRQKARKIKQTSEFNKKYYETKVLKQQYQSMQQINDYSGRYKQILNQLQSQKQQQLKQVELKRRRLKLQLDRQVQQGNIRKNLNSKMDDNQYLLNKSGHVPALPGLTKDFAAQKQQRILESFLKGGSKKSIQFSA